MHGPIALEPAARDAAAAGPAYRNRVRIRREVDRGRAVPAEAEDGIEDRRSGDVICIKRPVPVPGQVRGWVNCAGTS